MFLGIIVHIFISLLIFILLLRMFVSARDAYFNPIFNGIYRATDPIMAPVHKALRRKPVDTAQVDFLVLIPVVFLIFFDGVIMGVLTPGMSIPRGILNAIVSFADAAFLIYVILILIFSVFYKSSPTPSNPFTRTGFKIMEPMYIFIGRHMRPLKNWPGVTAFVIGLILHLIFGLLLFSLVTVGNAYVAEHPGAVGLLAIQNSLGTLLWLATFFTWTIIIGALMSWISPDPNNPIVGLIRLLSEPINRPFRKLVPTIGGIDITPIFSILILQLVAQTGARILAEIVVIPR